MLGSEKYFGYQRAMCEKDKLALQGLTARGLNVYENFILYLHTVFLEGR